MAKILTLDDDRGVLEFVTHALRNAGHEVVSSEDSLEAVELVKRQFFDVAVVDYQMPRLDGLDFLEQLKEIQPGCIRILASGKLDLPAVVGAVNRGQVTRVLEKPFLPRELVDSIADALTEYRRLADVSLAAKEEEASNERRQLVECLDQDLLDVAIQPIVQSRDGRIVAYEGLLRSRHDRLSSPEEILLAAERQGMLHAVDSVVARRVSEWLDHLPPELNFFLNLHPKELANPERIREQLAPLHCTAPRVVLEITERSRVVDLDAWASSAALLTGMGYSVAVDDLGAGYSSLSILAELRPAYMKVDRSIVGGVDGDPRKRRLIELLCRFAAATDARLVAEGVETREEAEALKACGADLLQGYFFGRPSLSPANPH